MNLLIARQKLFRSISRDDFDDLPQSKKAKLWADACKSAGVKPTYKSRTSTGTTTKTGPKRTRPPMTADRKEQLKTWAMSVAHEVQTRRNIEAETEKFADAPCYYGHR